ncbi:hypothetical protein E1295_32710 [Nonomuraea mesophila]|uniref:Uncharacterized protein n=1 Tax=Nonomuraea mesophila TaxID=2530382 RepID=A0A4R5EY92_9ACTN|nr:hypothetical protein [Nonomuraea mesophila]TDE39902.1 hypothetical protein E1295_32710 [Nonomuraea mesophila]
MIDAPRATAAFLSLILTAGLAGCSAEADQGEPGTDAGQAPSEISAETSVSGDFARQNMLITAVCSPGNRTAVLVDDWDPRSWKHMAHAEFPLPATAVVESDKHSPITAVRELCEPDSQPTDVGDATAIRSISTGTSRKWPWSPRTRRPRPLMSDM